ncbi:MAG TPA: ABC transporter permease [Candidatus Paenibacillus intestinavium]|nr:ABC transporter permease [Candidatus Paenibacillus intestinavium]
MSKLTNIPQIQNFIKYRFLLKELIIRDLKVKYKRSILGVFWTLLNPLFYMVILNLVFSTIFTTNISNFPVYLLCGSLLFGFFSEGTSSAMTSVYSNASLLTKVYIPKYLFPFSKIIFSLVNLFISLVALVVVMLFTDTPFHPTMWWFIIPIVYLFIFSLGIGLLLSCAAVFFRDLTHLYGIVLTALQFLTPLFYPVDILPEYIKPYVEANPIYQAIYMLRQLVLYNQFPTFMQHLNMFIYSLAVILLGLFLFYKKQDRFVLYA